MLSLFIIWLFKPIYDRFYLHYFSRRIFGQKITVKQVLKQAPKFLFKRSFPLLSWLRFSPSRSMILPIRDLEDLKGKDYSQRKTVIKRVGGGNAFMMMSALALGEAILILSLFTILISLNPQLEWPFKGVGLELLHNVINFFTELYSHWAIKVLTVVVPAFVYLLFEPFYVGAGFCLYLNSRSTQEAWDIELRFKEFAGRLRKTILGTGKASIILALLFIFNPLEGMAQEPTPQDVIEVVYEHEDFKEHYAEVPVPKSRRPSPEVLFLGAGFTVIIEVVLLIVAIIAILALLALIVYVVIKLVSNRGGAQLKETIKRVRPDMVMGMEITRESLPENLLAVARESWKNGKRKEALSYLYRAALSDIILDYNADIDGSDTEYECQRAAKKVLAREQNNYFSILTRGWISVAYSKHPISDDDFENLCQKWTFKLT